MTGSEMSWPMIVVDMDRAADIPATCGANPSSENAATLSRMVSGGRQELRRARQGDA
jgi:hypothetical protein